MPFVARDTQARIKSLLLAVENDARAHGAVAIYTCAVIENPDAQRKEESMIVAGQYYNDQHNDKQLSDLVHQNLDYVVTPGNSNDDGIMRV